MGILEFPCGCKFKTVDRPKDEVLAINSYDHIKHPKIQLNIYNIREDCPITWDLISSGNTGGVFQLESQLGKTWAKKIKPNNLEEAAALVSLIRPGCLHAIDSNTNKSLTQLYSDRKNNLEKVVFFHSSLKDILENTYAILTFQEQSIQIASKIAGFSLEDSDLLRKSMGKKLPELMEEVEKKFINGCKKQNIVNEKEAKEIFNWMKESQNYLFNKSHGISYSTHSYWSAYLKTHFPVQFYCSYLWGTKFKPDVFKEINSLVNDAKLNDVNINPPTLPRLNNVPVVYNNEVYFGLGNVKQIGDKALTKLIKTVRETEEELDKKIENWNWLDYLLCLADKNSISVHEALIHSGSLDFLKKNRAYMWYEIKNIWSKLTKKEKDWVKNEYNNRRGSYGKLYGLLQWCARPRKLGGGCSNINRINIVGDLAYICRKPPHKLQDTLDSIIWGENLYLGISLSAHEVDKYTNTMIANTTCKELLKHPKQYGVLNVKINFAREIKTKRGKTPGKLMAFLEVGDGTSNIDVVIFPDKYEEYKNILQEENVLLIRLKKTKQGSFSLQKAQLLE